MKEKETWKLLQNWIAIEKHQQDKTFLEHITSLNEQNRKLSNYNLELYYQEKEGTQTTQFLILTPYLIQLYEGIVTERKGTIQIENYRMIKQISNDLEEQQDKENSQNLVASLRFIIPFIETEAYILNGLACSNICYYQEKDENGLYRRILETNHYIKIGKKKNHAELNMETQQIGTFESYNMEELRLTYDKDAIVAVFENQKLQTNVILAFTKMTTHQVEKVYQLL